MTLTASGVDSLGTALHQLPAGAGFAIAIVDDQPVTRAGMEHMASQGAGLTVVASVASVDQLHAESEVVDRIDAVVLALPSPSRAPADPLITTVAAIAPTLLTSTWEWPRRILDAVRSGARGCVTRHCDRDVMLTAIRVIASGGFYMCSQLINRFQAELRHLPYEEGRTLAPREVETVRWIALGYTQSQIATRMGLTQATVNTYAKRIRSKLKVTNKAELTRMAIELGYLGDDRQGVPA